MQNDEPDPRRVDRPPAERTRSSSCHRPRDLRARPRLAHGAGAVVDLPERDLAGLARPDLHHPLARRGPELRVRLRLRRIAGEPVRHLGVAAEDGDRLRLGQARGALRGGERRLHEPAFGVVDGSTSGSCRPPRALRGRARLAQAERPELVSHEVQRGDEDDRERLREAPSRARAGRGRAGSAGSRPAR